MTLAEALDTPSPETISPAWPADLALKVNVASVPLKEMVLPSLVTEAVQLSYSRMILLYVRESVVAEVAQTLTLSVSPTKRLREETEKLA
jgi:hypothetical protein